MILVVSIVYVCSSWGVLCIWSAGNIDFNIQMPCCRTAAHLMLNSKVCRLSEAQPFIRRAKHYQLLHSTFNVQASNRQIRATWQQGIYYHTIYVCIQTRILRGDFGWIINDIDLSLPRPYVKYGTLSNIINAGSHTTVNELPLIHTFLRLYSDNFAY